MLTLYRKNSVLYVKVIMNLRLPIEYKNKLFNKGHMELLLEPDEVLQILTHNGNIKLWDGKKYVKMHMGEFYDIIQRKAYIIEEVEEPKKEEVKKEVKVEEPKKEEYKQNENKKQRHNNNKQQNQGGGDK